MFQPRCLNRLRAPNLLPTSCYTNTKPRQPPVVHSASIASTVLTTGDANDPDLYSLPSTGAVNMQITQIQRILSAVGDRREQRPGKAFSEGTCTETVRNRKGKEYVPLDSPLPPCNLATCHSPRPCSTSSYVEMQSLASQGERTYPLHCTKTLPGLQESCSVVLPNPLKG